MISRHWKGLLRRDQAEAYVEHLRRQTLPSLSAIPGFVRATVLRRDVERGIEFQVVTVWESLDAIRAFAGPDVEAALVPTVAAAMMVEWDERATHYEIVG